MLKLKKTVESEYKVPHITEQGLRRLGKVIKYHRSQKKLSLKAFCDEIEKNTGYKIATATISALERGVQKPDFETINFIGYSGLVPYSTYQLFDFALEISIPKELFEEFE